MTEHTINLHARLWDIANTLRGKMGADDFRDYILGFIFYKYLSDKMDSYGAEEELDKQRLFLSGAHQRGYIRLSWK